MNAVSSVDDYIASQPAPLQPLLERVRTTIRKAIPGAEESISYRIPTYKLHGRPVLYFAGFKEHYSIYPTTKPLLAAFKDELASYDYNSKGTIRFSLDKPVPARLIARLAKFRAEEVTALAAARSSARTGTSSSARAGRRTERAPTHKRGGRGR